jgi:hypothetical protein
VSWGAISGLPEARSLSGKTRPLLDVASGERARSRRSRGHVFGSLDRFDQTEASRRRFDDGSLVSLLRRHRGYRISGMDRHMPRRRSLWCPLSTIPRYRDQRGRFVRLVLTLCLLDSFE